MDDQHGVRLHGKVALITGASGAFGTAAVQLLASAGARVVLVGRRREELERLTGMIEPLAAVIEGNVSRAGEAERIVQIATDAYGRIDILVNAAGGATVGGLMDLSDEAWAADINLKLLGYLRMMRAAAHVMRAQGGGRIINIVGLAGHEPYHLLTAPSVINAGLLALTKTAADELARDHILVNAINPNAAETRLGDTMIADLAAAQGSSPRAVHDYLVSATPLGRLVRPQDVAAAVLFLASDLSTFMTGTSLTLDGGAHRAIA